MILPFTSAFLTDHGLFKMVTCNVSADVWKCVYFTRNSLHLAFYEVKFFCWKVYVTYVTTWCIERDSLSHVLKHIHKLI